MKTSKTKKDEPAPKPRMLPAHLFALHRAASTDPDRPSLGVVRVEPGSAMATDGVILLKVVPAEKFAVKEDFVIAADMCGQILKALKLSGEDAFVGVEEGKSLRLSVGQYSFSPTYNLEMFEYKSLLDQKGGKLAHVAMSVERLGKLVKCLKALGAEVVTLEVGAPLEPVVVEADVSGLDRITGAIMPMKA